MASDDDPIPTRAEPRVRVSVPVRVDADGDSSEHSTADLSAGGAFVATLTRVAPDARVVLELRVGEESLRLAAVVRWVRREQISALLPAGAGVAFEALGPAERARIAIAIGGAPPASGDEGGS